MLSRHDLDADVLALHGELDLASAPQLERELVDAPATDGKGLVIDLSGLEFMDSTGLHLLLAANQRSQENGQRRSLRPGPPAVHRVFELTKTTTLFRFER
jgi:anti-sigma B factor antagonist